ncbi:hypothetical protein GQ457_04G014560 [Hibiscus cannabinus]
MAVGYIQTLFSTSGVSSGMYSSSGILFPQMALARAMDSERPVNSTDIRRAIFGMGPLQAPGIDGFNALFFQHNWDLVGANVCHFISNIFSSGIIPEEINRTLLSCSIN